MDHRYLRNRGRDEKAILYVAYEKRYQAVFSAGAERWGHSPNDDALYNTLNKIGSI